MLRKTSLMLCLLVQACLLSAQSMWNYTPVNAVPVRGERRIVPQRFKAVQLDVSAMQSFLQTAPERFSATAGDNAPVLVLPTPDGRWVNFRLYESPVMAPELQGQYPEIRCYTGVGIDDPGALLKCDLTPWGFHAMVFSARNGTWLIDPFSHGDNEYYVVYNKSDYLPRKNAEFACLTEEEPGETLIQAAPSGQASTSAASVSDCKLRTYRLALACTGEYAAFHGGTKPLVLAAMNTSMNRVNGVYENDLAVTMVIIPNNDLLIYLNSATDPYTNGNGSTMLGQNVTTCNSVIGSANYDIGHVFSTGGGGIAGLGVVCGSNKANGVTGSGSPVGDAYDIDYVAHEMGHQFGANHTQNNNCNRVIAASMEPGSASTIMGYAGICAPDVQPHSDDYFHAISLQEIGVYITTGNGNTCPVKTITGNTAPLVSAGADYTIPKSTPFVLTAEGSDVDNDSLSYCWEQMDPQFATMPPVSTSATGPLFRSYKATPEPERYFPRLPDLVANINSDWEELPGVARTMKFRVTVRDNKAAIGGCTDEDDMVVTVAGTAGPFVVTSPNTAVTWYVGETKTISWNVANTNLAPVNCSNVRLLLSKDGGYTYPVVLADNVPNNGSATITVPNEASATCRIMVAAVDNIFFDISNQNFAIVLPPSPTFLLNASVNSLSVCAGETGSLDLEAVSIVGFTDSVTVTVSGAPAGAVVDITPSSIQPTGSVNITLGGLSSDMAGSYTLVIQAASNSLTKSLNLPLNIFPGAPTSLPQAAAPVNGATGLGAIADLSWQPVQYAENYTVQVATNPSFAPGTLVGAQTVSGTSAQFSGLSAPTVYYWRTVAQNLCGSSTYSDVASFQTGVLDCNVPTYTSTNVPLTLDANTVNTASSTLSVPANAVLGDVNVSVTATHTWVGDLIAKLVSPAGDSILLFDQPGVPATSYGCSNDNLALTFNDQAAGTSAALEAMCNTTNPALSGSFQPLEALAGFNGQNAQGTWRLLMTDNYPEDGGALTGWSLNLCFVVPTPAAILLANNELTVPNAGSGVIDASLLQAQVTGNAGQLVYVLMNVPAHGSLYLNGAPLSVGSTFTQADVNAGLLSYTNNGDGSSADSFPFQYVDQNNFAWNYNGIFNIAVLQNTLAAGAEATIAVPCAGAAGGQITVTATGGNPPLQFSLNGGAGQSSNVFTDLPAGAYTVVVSDAFGFTVETNTVQLDDPSPLAASATANGSTVSVSAVGGAGNYQYSLDGNAFQSASTFENVPNGLYTVIVQDANGCLVTDEVLVSVGVLAAVAEVSQHVSCNGGANGAIQVMAAGGVDPLEYSLDGVNFQQAPLFSDLAAGTYTVTIKDADGTTITAGPVDVTQPEAVQATSSANFNVISVAASGGTGAYTYSLDGLNYQASNTFGNLANGTYTVTVQDANGCTATSTATVDVPALALVDVTATPIACNGDVTSLSVSASGGVPPLEYSLDNGGFQSSNEFDNIPAGVHTVRVRDAAGTEVETALTIAEPAPLEIQISIVGNDITNVLVLGGTSPYTYSFPANFPPNGENIPNGTYTLTVTDANGCLAFATFTINYTQVSASATHADPLCFGDSNGSITVQGLNGTPAYEFALNNGSFQSANIFGGLSAGVYTITVRDALGDTYTLSVTLSNPPAIVATANVSFDTVTINASGGTAPLTYNLDNLGYQSSPQFLQVPLGVHTVFVKDAHGCIVAIENVTVTTVGTSDTRAEWGLTVMPNPSNGLFRVYMSHAPASDLRADVFDATGRLLLHQIWSGANGTLEETIDLSQLPQGMYALRLSDNKQVVALRLSVER